MPRKRMSEDKVLKGEILLHTESICPECLKRIPARYVEDEGKVFMEKDCPEHGAFRTLVWSDAKGYADWMSQSVHAMKTQDVEPVLHGCPYDCGLCGEHEGKTCTAVLEITYRCNMHCEICFADTAKHCYEPDLAKIRRMYETAYRFGGDCSIQLSGGEPAMREDIFDILRMGKEMHFSHIQVNTNGIRLAEEADYAYRLKAAGADLIYLQFDSLRDEVYKITRGREIADIKFRAIENCAAAGIGVMLVPVMIKGVNDGEIGALVEFAKAHMPTVKGIHFQPVSYFGRYPDREGRQVWGHMNLADVMRELERQTRGELKQTDMVPRKKYDAHCAFSSAYFLDENKVLRAITGKGQNTNIPSSTDFSAKTNTFTNRFWRQPQEKKEPAAHRMDMRGFIKRLRDYTLTVSGMGFQDAYNLDLGRLRGCCVHVITDDEKAVPLCAFHLTGNSGKRLYGNGK